MGRFLLLLLIVLCGCSCQREDLADRIAVEKKNSTEHQFARLLNTVESGFGHGPLPDVVNEGEYWRLDLFLTLDINIGSETDLVVAWTVAGVMADPELKSFVLNARPSWICRDDGSCFAVAIGGKDAAFSGRQRMNELPKDVIHIMEIQNPNLDLCTSGNFNLDDKERVNDWFDRFVPDPFLVGFADGSFWKVSKQVPLSVLCEQCSIRDYDPRRAKIGEFCLQKYDARQMFDPMLASPIQVSEVFSGDDEGK